MTQEAAETKPAATKATAKKTPRPKGSHSATEVYQAPGGDPGHCKKRSTRKAVEYKFAKIGDVYRLLTPAMNEHGVNFDIVAETATRHTPEGDPFTTHHYTMNESARRPAHCSGVREDSRSAGQMRTTQRTLEVTLHAIGTNDGGPDKGQCSDLLLEILPF